MIPYHNSWKFPFCLSGCLAYEIGNMNKGEVFHKINTTKRHGPKENSLNSCYTTSQVQNKAMLLK